MVKLTRERIALVVFFVLVALGAFVLMSYFSTGRGWSVAATAMDDSVGQLDRYTAIVYNGVAQPEAAASGATGKPLAASDPEEDSTETDRETGLGLRLLTLAAEVDSAEEGRIYVSDVREIYETRGANVLTLDLAEGASRYAQPIVFDASGKKVGIFSVKERLPRTDFHSIVDDLREQGAESVICITPRPVLVSDYDGVDVVLVTQGDHEYSVQNEPEDDTVIVKSPNEGSVGVILLSSNNVPSAKTIESL